MLEPKLSFACLAVGPAHAEATRNVLRLQAMLGRHCPRPFVLHCFTDQALDLPSPIVTHDCSGWSALKQPGMRPTTRKLGFFNPDHVPIPEFWYLDQSLVIRNDMTPLLDFADTRSEALIIVEDWHHGGYNSSVMRIRPAALRAVYDAFVNGERYVQRVAGDQEFIFNAIARHGLASEVALIPRGMVCSFKAAVRLCRRDVEAARAVILDAQIVKFHGRPKMTEAFGLKYKWTKIRPYELLQGYVKSRFPIDSLRNEWRAGD